MATEKTINARMQMKTDTALNWSKAINFIPKKGEIIIYEADSDYGYERMKIGDGSTKVNDLPFVIGAKDWNQNDSTASDYIKNRPGGYTVNYPALNIEWDGVIGDRVSVDIAGMKAVKVSDEIPKVEQLLGARVTVKTGDKSHTTTIDNMEINDYNDSTYGTESLLVVNEAPSNIVDPSTGSVAAVLPETGVYFIYYTNESGIVHISSLSLPAKSEIVPIPGELTNIVGGYVGKEKNEPLIDAVVPASSFELYTTSSETYYNAPITLSFTPADGDLIRGTINDVEVNGSWIGISKYANLYRVGNRDVPFCAIGFLSEKAVISLQQASAPTTDYELHLYRYVPASIVQIPQEYVEGLEETTANANQALNNATEAQSTANEIKNVVQPADTNNNGIKIKRYIGFKDVLNEYGTLEMSPDTNGCIYLRKSRDRNGVTLVIGSRTKNNVNLPSVSASIGSEGLTLAENSKIVAPISSSGIGTIIRLSNDTDRAYVEFTKDACLVLPSSTPKSTKKFKITVDDTGTISATEVAT